jgi:hypothetical protein
MESAFSRVTDALRWPPRNAKVLGRAFAMVDREPWCLLTSWRADFSLDLNWQQYRALEEGLARSRYGMLPLVAHYRADGERTSAEPWVFATHCERTFAEWLLRRLRQPFVFWGDQTSLHVLRSVEPARQLGEARPGAIAHVICESSPARAGFLGFDEPSNGRTTS